MDQDGFDPFWSSRLILQQFAICTKERIFAGRMNLRSSSELTMNRVRQSLLQYLAYGKRIDLQPGTLVSSFLPKQPIDAGHPIKVGPFNGFTYLELMSPEYRSRSADDPRLHRIKVLAGASIWWFFSWQLWQRPKDIINHYHVPSPSTWTDEELGVPPEDYDGWNEYL